jgi:hypothetical protein
MFLLYLPHTYANMMAGKNVDMAYPRKTDENLAKDDGIDKVVSKPGLDTSFLHKHR